MKNLLFVMFFIVGPLPLVADDGSSQFRGPLGNGVFGEQDIPLEWAAGKNVAWSVEVPGSGWSQPVIRDGRVYLTTAVGEFKPKNFAAGARTPQSMPGFAGQAPDILLEWMVVCLSAANGEMLWKAEVVTGKPKFGIHPSNSYATETPVVNEHGVFAYFGMAGQLVAFDHDGNRIWRQEIGQYPTDNSFGTGSSLASDGKNIFLQKFGSNVSDVFAFDCQSGKQQWKYSRANQRSAWSTPVVWKNSLRHELIVSGGDQIESLDPKTGDLIWKAAKTKSASACSVCTDGDKLFFGSSDPFSKGPLFAVGPGGTGDLTPKIANSKFDSVLWLNRRAGPGMASPVAGQSVLYVIDRNVLKCYDSNNGTEIYKERLPKLRMLAASPIIVGERLFLLDEDGEACVVQVGKEFKILGQSKIDDVFWSTPTVAQDSLYLARR